MRQLGRIHPPEKRPGGWVGGRLLEGCPGWKKVFVLYCITLDIITIYFTTAVLKYVEERLSTNSLRLLSSDVSMCDLCYFGLRWKRGSLSHLRSAS